MEGLIRFSELFVTGIMVGSIYALIALGWVIIAKCSGVLNLAMGELTLIGGYTCFFLYMAGVPFPLAVLGTMIIGVILGFSTERLFLRPMIGEPLLSVIMITVGLAFLFKGLIALIFGTHTVVFTPALFPIEPLLLGPIRISLVFLYSFVVAILLMLALTYFFQRTRVGLAMQATADDETAALSMGISAKQVYALTWALAFVTAGIAGALLGNINGLNIAVGFMGLLVLPAVVIGGINSIPGAIVGGLIIGVLQNLGDAYISGFTPGGVKEVFPFFVMLIVLLFLPYGLWGWVRIERV